MILDRVTFLCGFNARAKAYAQAMAHYDFTPSQTLVYGREASGRPGQEQKASETSPMRTDFFLPDLAEPLSQTLDRAAWKTQYLSCLSINDMEIAVTLRANKPRLVIFCGYGSEIVSRTNLDIAPFLHIHAGWLPDYRGSTTGYYSWLEKATVGATAILLDENIDTGAILMRQQYPLPSPDVDFDYLYEPALRADLLIRVLRHLEKFGAPPDPLPQPPSAARTFYVVHPLLKHLALLSLKAKPAVNKATER